MKTDDALPGQLTLKPHLLPFWPLGVMFVVLATVLILRIPADMVTPVNGQKTRWLLGIALGVFLIFGVIAYRTPVRLDAEGFVDAKGRRHVWKECSEFEVTEAKVGKIILSDVKTTSSEIGKVGVWASFGMTNAELATLLNRFRARALGLNG